MCLQRTLGGRACKGPLAPAPFSSNVPQQMADAPACPQVERISQHEARHAELLQRLPEHVQQHFRQRQQDAAPSDAALRWSIPQPILDEGHFRAEHAGDTSADDSE